MSVVDDAVVIGSQQSQRVLDHGGFVDHQHIAMGEKLAPSTRRARGSLGPDYSRLRR